MKRISVRFDLSKPDERRAWEYLQSVSGSRNKAVIDALNANRSIADVIRETIRDCLKNVSLSAPQEAPTALSEEESELMDIMDSFLG